MAAKRGEYPALPSVVAEEREHIQLFLTYLRQETTRKVLLAAARSLSKYGAMGDLILLLSGQQARNQSELRGLLRFAPALKAVCNFAQEVGLEVQPRVIPLRVFPSDGCLDAAVAAYHAWVRTQAKRRK